MCSGDAVQTHPDIRVAITASASLIPSVFCACLVYCPTGSARKLGHVLVEALDARRAEAGGAASGGVTVTAGEAGLV